MKVQFERISQLIAVASVCDKSITQFYLKSGEYETAFSDYVKSQIHLNVVKGLKNRNMKEYVEALYFLRGSLSYRDSALTVLRYFYDDMANLLINNPENILLMLTVDTELFKLERMFVKLDSIRDSAISTFHRVQSGDLDFDDWEYSKAFDYAKDSSDFENKAMCYAFAQKLNEAKNNLVILESGL